MILEFANILRPQTLSQLPQFVRVGRLYPHLFWSKRVEAWVSSQGMRIEQVRAWHKVPVEILAHIDSKIVIRALFHMETVLQRILPREFLSRSLVLSALKTRLKDDESNSSPQISNRIH